MGLGIGVSEMRNNNINRENGICQLELSEFGAMKNEAKCEWIMTCRVQSSVQSIMVQNLNSLLRQQIFMRFSSRERTKEPCMLVWRKTFLLHRVSFTHRNILEAEGL